MLEAVSSLSCSDVVDGVLTVPASATSIPSDAFRGCSFLTSVTFEAGSHLITIQYGAFRESGLTSIAIPASVTSIEGAFIKCAALTSVSFEAGSELTSIGTNAFYESGLTSITIPASVTIIERNAFYGCTVLTSVTYKCSVNHLSVKNNAFAGTPYAAQGRAIPASTCRVVNMPLDCSAVDSNGHLIIPASVTSIEGHSFQSCKSLLSVSFAAGSYWYILGLMESIVLFIDNIRLV
jgi:hypothetical protein